MVEVLILVKVIHISGIQDSASNSSVQAAGA